MPEELRRILDETVIAMAKKRRATIPLVIGPSFRLEPDHFNWSTVESAYDQRLSREQREKIFEATQTYITFRSRETSSEPIRLSVHRLKRLKNSAESFRKIIVEDDSGSMAHVFADKEIKLQFSDDYLVAEDPLVGLTSVVQSFVHACKFAITNLTKHRFSNPDGIAWRNWVIELTRIAQQARLPTGARKDSDKNTGEPSPFVRFVEALQSQLPKQYQDKRQSPIALAKAIHRVRRDDSPGHKQRHIERKEVPPKSK